MRVVQVAADLFDPDAAPLLAERALDELGRIDVLVNNMGGGGDPTRLHKLTNDDWQQGFELNFFSSVRTTAACLPTMLERGWGRIVHVASTYGVEPGPYFGPYSAAKAALLNYSKNLSHAYLGAGRALQLRDPGHHHHRGDQRHRRRGRRGAGHDRRRRHGPDDGEGPGGHGPLRRPAGGRGRGRLPRPATPPAGSPAPPSPSTAAPSAASDPPTHELRRLTGSDAVERRNLVRG